MCALVLLWSEQNKFNELFFFLVFNFCTICVFVVILCAVGIFCCCCPFFGLIAVFFVEFVCRCLCYFFSVNWRRARINLCWGGFHIIRLVTTIKKTETIPPNDQLTDRMIAKWKWRERAHQKRNKLNSGWMVFNCQKIYAHIKTTVHLLHFLLLFQRSPRSLSLFYSMCVFLVFFFAVRLSRLDDNFSLFSVLYSRFVTMITQQMV